LNWSMRKRTCTSHKIPPNAEELCVRAFLRLCAAQKLETIHADFVVNANQSGVNILPMGSSSYEVKGSTNVHTLTHDEKRQFTIVLASSMLGNILPFQSVWGGTTDESLPACSAHQCAEADALGFIYAHGDTCHWSSRDSTKEWVRVVLDPYLARMHEKHHLPLTAKSILLLDVWPVHIANKNSEDFLPWLRWTNPSIITIFVPGGC
ncbi:hypothetical protein WOLCODRAFT_60336, partial [Wolfiporia cocos MD-104 SS10]